MSLDTDIVGLESTAFTQASEDPKWTKAMSEKFNALLENNTWKLVPFQSGQNLVGCKWVYRVKFNSDGCIERYNARLVAFGNHQQTDVDYHETFSPVIKPPTIRPILSLTLSYNWPIS